MLTTETQQDVTVVDNYAATVHQFDNIDNWYKGGFEKAPWSKDQIASFQKRIDSAFGAERAIVLVWSGDRSYGEEMFMDWYFNGLPKGRPEKKPVLLFGEYPVNDGNDWLYVYPPRWCLMEAHHGSQLEASWEDSSWVADETFAGGRKRIRPEKPPEFYYVHLNRGVLAYHEQPIATGDVPPCCRRAWDADRRICYGSYREPGDEDIAMIRAIRENMDKFGVAQRNDAPRDAKTVMAANLATKHFVEKAQHRRFTAAKELILGNVSAFCGDILAKKGSAMSNIEVERIVKGALERQEEERFA